MNPSVCHPERSEGSGRRAGKTRFFAALRMTVAACALIVTGCASAVEHGQSTALSGVDLVQMTDDMAMKIAGDSDVERAIAERGPLKVVVLPVENRMRAEVLPRGAAEAFVGRVRTLLSRHAPQQFTWVMNRDAWHRLRERRRGERLEVHDRPPFANPVSS